MHKVDTIKDKDAQDHGRDVCDSCSCGHGHGANEHEHGGNAKWIIVRLSAALLLMIAAWLWKPPIYIEISLFAAAYLLCGADVAWSAIKSIVRGRALDENCLMFIASAAAFVIGEMGEAVAVLLLYSIGEMLQDRAVDKSLRSISALTALAPDTANLLTGGGIVEVPPERCGIGDTVVVRPGERIPCDGEIVSGSGMIDTRALTGESVPVHAEIGDAVLAGTISNDGLLHIRITRTYADSAVSRILTLVRDARERKAPAEQFITRFARIYTPVVVGLAAAVAVLPVLFGASFDTWLYRGLSLLIISCPCALVISVPVSYFGGLGGAAKHGLLVKGGNYLDVLSRVRTVVFDKTGTLTYGSFDVTAVSPANGVDSATLLRYAAIAESGSTHPIARAICDYAAQCGISPDTHGAQPILTEHAGHGVSCDLDSGTVYVGNAAYLARRGIDTPPSTLTMAHVALDDVYLGNITIADTVRADAQSCLGTLSQFGIKTVMLSGDNAQVAEYVGGALGIADVRAPLLPDGKLSAMEEIAHLADAPVAFVGDGINDAPVLMRADVGVAMGGIGSDAAINAADAVLMHDRLSSLTAGVAVAHKTRRVVRQNIFASLGVKFLIMLLAVCGVGSLWLAIFADVGVALLATANALRCSRVKL